MRTRPAVVVALLLTLDVGNAYAQAPTRFTVEDMLAIRTFAGGQPVAIVYAVSLDHFIHGLTAGALK